MYQVYKYIAVNINGDPRKGHLFAINKEVAAKYLLRYKLTPIKIKARSRITSLLIYWFFKLVAFRGKRRLKTNIVRQLADYLLQSYSLPEALLSTIENMPRLDIKLQLHQILQDVQAGYLLSKSLKRHSNFFTDSEIKLLENAERNNTLAEAMDGLHFYLNHTLKKENLFFWYVPAVLAIALTASISNSLANELYPFFLYDLWMLGVDVPVLGHIFLFLYKGSLIKNIALGLPAFLALVILIRFLLKLTKFKFVREYFLCHLPLVKGSVRLSSVCEFTQAMALGLKAKLPLHHVIKAAAEAVTIDKYQKQLLKIHHKVVAGYDFTTEIKYTDLLKQEDVFQFQSAFKTNRLSETVDFLLEYATNRYQTQMRLKNQIIKQSIVAFVIAIIALSVLATFQIMFFVYY